MDSELKRRCLQKICEHQPFSISFSYADQDMYILINTILAKLLSNEDRIYILNPVSAVVRELVDNAQKANLARILAEKEQIPEEDSEAFLKALAGFREKAASDADAFSGELKNSRYYVRLDFINKNGIIDIYVRNNVVILHEELELINYRISKAASFDEFGSVLDIPEKEREGEGLGLILAVMLLRSIGADTDNFRIGTDGKHTVAAVRIPAVLRPLSVTGKIKEEILADVDVIPTFPEHVQNIQALCEDQSVALSSIASEIMKDPALSADVIRLSNSASFVPGRRIETVKDAVKLLGTHNINALLAIANARKIMEKRYSHFEHIWEHLLKTAFYARQIVNTSDKKNLSDIVFTAGLLHDLGQIVLLSAGSGISEKIGALLSNHKLINAAVLEEASIGISHSEIGSLIAKKWNFPESLQCTIRCHHDPLNAEPEYRTITFAVYLANMFCGIEENKYMYDYIEENVLDWFFIFTMDELKAFHAKLRKEWEKAESIRA